MQEKRKKKMKEEFRNKGNKWRNISKNKGEKK